MKVKTEVVQELLKEVEYLLEAIYVAEKKASTQIEAVAEAYRKSARNLIHYQRLRDFDLRSMQKKLRNLGMSRIAHAEGHVEASLLNTCFILKCLLGKKPGSLTKSRLSPKSGKKLLTKHTKELLGYRSKNRRVRIMVTLPTEAAKDYSMVYALVQNGMNCARINCAHDSPELWEKMIAHVKKASKALGRKVRITMDLAGPKIRTGTIEPGPKIRRFRPERDDSGLVIQPALIALVPQLHEESLPHELPVPQEWMLKLQPGMKVSLQDTRKKQRILKVIQVQEAEVLLHCYDTSYIGTGTQLVPANREPEPVLVGELPPVERFISLRVNDRLTVHKDQRPGEPARYDEDGNLLQQAHISCQLGAVFDSIQVGEPVLFDDGKISSRVVSKNPEAFEVEITRAREPAAKLKAEKGINFPSTRLNISGLTAKDREDLAFIATHAHVVNFSFVNSPADVEELYSELSRHGALSSVSVILKVETCKAFDELVPILLKAMQSEHVGVMIARGDLAVETGWDAIGWVQKEILLLCNAGHVPVVWATQVLENLAKKGLPSRAEITDATSSLKAECVMLNKGWYINDAIRLLDKILSDMEATHEKNEPMLPKLKRLS